MYYILNLEEIKNKLVDEKEIDIIRQITYLAGYPGEKVHVLGKSRPVKVNSLIKDQERRLKVLKWCKEHTVREILQRYENVYQKLCFKCKLSILGSIFIPEKYCSKCKSLYLEAVLLLLALGVVGK